MSGGGTNQGPPEQASGIIPSLLNGLQNVRVSTSKYFELPLGNKNEAAHEIELEQHAAHHSEGEEDQPKHFA